MSAAQIVGSHQRESIRAALVDGELIVIPGHGGYEVAGLLVPGTAMSRLTELVTSHGEGSQPTCLVGVREQVREIAEWDVSARRLAERMWPGPLTLMVPARQELIGPLSDDNDLLQVAMASTKLLRTLCREAGPLLSVGLRQFDGATIATVGDAVNRCADTEASLAIDNGRRDGPGSTVVDCSRTPPVVTRVGALPESYVDAVLLMSAFRRRRWLFGPRQKDDAE